MHSPCGTLPGGSDGALVRAEVAMRIGVVFPQVEIGQDPSAIRDHAQAVEAAVPGLTRGLALSRSRW